MCFVISVYKADIVFFLYVALIGWIFASDTAGTIQTAEVVDDFGSCVFSINFGIHSTIFVMQSFIVQSVAGAVYDAMYQMATRAVLV